MVFVAFAVAVILTKPADASGYTRYGAITNKAFSKSSSLSYATAIGLGLGVGGSGGGAIVCPPFYRGLRRCVCSHGMLAHIEKMWMPQSAIKWRAENG